MRETEIETFEAVSDSGESYILRVFQSWINADTHDGLESIPGHKRVVESNGKDVIRRDANTFVLHTGVVLTRK